jgi:signal transduction histidine kinase/putative methionine-R-sulfoxide reductase with GAF domain
MSDKNSPPKIRFRGHIITLLIVAILLGVFGCIVYIGQQKKLKQEIYSGLRVISTLKAEQLVNWMNERLNIANVIQGDKSLINDVSNFLKNRNNREIRERVEYTLKTVCNDTNFSSIFLLSPDLNVELRVNVLHEIGGNAKVYLQEVLKNKKILFSDLHRSSTVTNVHMDIYIPLFNSEKGANKLAAILMIRVEPDIFMFPLVQFWPTLSKTSETLLIRRDGDSVLFLNELRNRKNTALNLRISLKDSLVPAVKGALGYEGYFEGVDYRGKKVLSEIVKVSGTDWIMVTKIDMDEILLPLNRNALLIFIIVIVCMIGAALIFFFMQKNQKLRFYKENYLLEAAKNEANKNLEHLNRMYLFLSQMNQMILRIKDVKALYKEACSIAVHFGKFDSVWVGIVDKDAQAIVPYFSEGTDIKLISNNIISLNTGVCVVQKAVNDNKIVVNNDFLKEGKYKECESFIMEKGYRSAAAIPVNLKGEVNAVFVIYSKIPDYFDNQQTKLLEEVGMDISFATEMIDAGTVLRENQKLLSTVLEIMPVGVIILDKAGHIMHGNSTSQKIWGGIKYVGPEGYYLYKGWYTSNGKMVAPNDWAAARVLKTGKEVKEEEIEIEGFDGSRKIITDMALPITGSNKKPDGVIVVIQDITEKKKNVLELIEAKETAEKSNKLKSEFLAQISHEIRSPIYITMSYVSLIKEDLGDSVSPEILEYINAINSAGKRLIRTVDLILNMSEIQVGSYEPSWENIDLAEDIFNDIKMEYEGQAKKKGLGFSFCSNVSNPIIYADKYSIKQIFTNLIDNAIKYTLSGEIKIIIQQGGNKDYDIIVEDTGIGISAGHLPMIFEPFMQEDRGYSRKYEGNGLGLALVKKYCDLNNAEIHVDSVKGNGSRFIVKFEAKK